MNKAGRQDKKIITAGRSELFVGLCEQLGDVFLQIARLSELAQASTKKTDSQKINSTIADLSAASMYLTDAFATESRLADRLLRPNLEPLTVGSLLSEAVAELKPLAQQYEVDLDIENLSKMNPVMGDRLVLQAALVCLGQVFVQASASLDKPKLFFGAHRSRYGVVAGVYSAELPPLTAPALRRARRMIGQVDQPFGQFVHGSAAGVFVAEKLLASIETSLHVAKYRKLTGLAVTLPACNQLQLV